MAKPKFSGIGIVDLQNSIRNTTFSRNAYGTYSKNKIGAPASTAPLVAWQNIVSSLRFDWINIMAESDRVEWYSFYVKRRNNMADAVTLNGFDAYLSVNMNRAIFLLPPLYNPPPYTQNPQAPGINFINALTVGTFTVSSGGIFRQNCAIYATPLMSAGRMSLNQIYTLIGRCPAGTFDINLFPMFTARFGALVVGKKVFVKLTSIEPATGARGSSVLMSGIVT